MLWLIIVLVAVAVIFTAVGAWLQRKGREIDRRR
jgi:hypothetical protein